MGEAARGHIFLSHNAQDKPEVEVLARQLLDRGLHPWLDKWEIAAGRSWQEALQDAIEQASAVLVCVGAHGLGRVQLPEFEMALDRALADSARLVVPVFLPSARVLELPPSLKQRSAVDLRSGEPAYRQLFATLGTCSLPTAPRAADESPFRGLRAFEERHARWYFGRETYLARLLGALRQRRLLALIGASGSGKSSLVRAGLIPAVRTGELDQSYAWVPLLLRPGARPLHELAQCVAGALGAPRELAALREGMLRDPGLLADELDRAAVRADRELRFLLVVDQFEEVLTLCEDRAARAAFIAALLHAASVAGGRTYVVWTLRSDFMAPLLEHPGLAEPLDRSNVLLGPMSEAELRSVIRRPALIAGAELESGLEDLLVQGVVGEPGDLPLLQFALEELWRQREGARMTLAAYRRMGGLKGVIARRADAELTQFDAPQRALVRRLFGRLVQLGEGNADTRRRLEVSELAATHPELRAPLEALIGARLLTVHEHEVEIAHEALIREWATLREWIDADRALVRLQQELARAAALWLQSGEASDLWSGGRLTRALELRAGGQLTLSAPEEAFLEAAAGAAACEADSERERQQRELEVARSLASAQASAARRLRVGLAGAALLLPALAAAAATARERMRTAVSARAEQETTIAEAIGVAQIMLGSVDWELRDLAGTAEVRSKILQSGGALLDRLSAGVDAAALAQLERSRAEYHEQAAELALSAHQTTRAHEELEAALQIRERLAQSGPEDDASQLALAAAHESFGRVLATRGERAEARAAYEKAFALREALTQKHPANTELALGLASTRRLLDNLRAFFDMPDGEIVEQRRAAELRERLVAENPTDAALRSELAQTYFHLGKILQVPQESLGYLRRALAIQEPLARENASSLGAQRALSETHWWIGEISWDAGDLDGARQASEESVAINRKLAAGDPAAVPRLIDTLASLGGLEVWAGRMAVGRTHLEEAIRHAESLSSESRDSYRVTASVNYCLCIVAEAYQELGTSRAARQSLERSLAGLRGMLERDPNDKAARRRLRICSMELGVEAQREGRLADALTAFATTLSLADQLLAELPGGASPTRGMVEAQMQLAGLDLAEGRFADARRAQERSLALIASIPEEQRRASSWLLKWPENQSWLGRTAQAEGRFADAIRHHELALAALQKNLQEQPSNTRAELEVGRSHRALGAALEAAGRSDEARRQYALALSSHQVIAERAPGYDQAQRGVAVAYLDLGRLAQSVGRLPEARAAHRQAQALFEELLRANPESQALHAGLAEALRELGRVAQAAGELSEARRLLEQSRDCFQDLTQQDPHHVELGRELAISHSALSELARGEGKLEEALSEQQRSLALTRQLLAREPTDFQARRALVQGQLALAGVQRSAGEPEQARVSVEQALASAEQNLQESPSSALAVADLAEARAQLAAARSTGTPSR